MLALGIPGRTVVFYAVAERLPNGNWLVYCHRCRSQIGTMTSEGLNNALHETASRNGIQCPACRRDSCTRCGAERRQSDKQLCRFCRWEENDAGKTPGPPCLSIVHNSFSVSESSH